MSRQQQKAESRRQKLAVQRSAFSVQRSRRGLTLVELLVVIAVLATVTVATIPIVLPALDSRRMRESARILSTQLAAAQALAVSTGRPAGIWIERMTADVTGGVDLHLCESPPPYSGDTLTSVINVRYTSGTPQACQVTFDAASDASWRPSMVTNIGLLRPGDLIQFGHRGTWYRFLGSTPAHGGQTNVTVQGADGVEYLDNSPNKYVEPASPNDYDASGRPIFRSLPPRAEVATFSPNPFPHPPQDDGWYTPYRILRQPVKLSSGSVSLPAGAVIDLNYSGIGYDQLYQAVSLTNEDQLAIDNPANRLPMLLTFNAAGTLEKLYLRSVEVPLNQPFHLLIGKREKLRGTAASQGQRNLYDLETHWVSINPQSGLVTTAEMRAVPGFDYDNPPEIVTLGGNPLQEARQFATSAQSMGGR